MGYAYEYKIDGYSASDAGGGVGGKQAEREMRRQIKRGRKMRRGMRVKRCTERWTARDTLSLELKLKEGGRGGASLHLQRRGAGIYPRQLKKHVYDLLLTTIRYLYKYGIYGYSAGGGREGGWVGGWAGERERQSQGKMKREIKRKMKMDRERQRGRRRGRETREGGWRGEERDRGYTNINLRYIYTTEEKGGCCRQ